MKQNELLGRILTPKERIDYSKGGIVSQQLTKNSSGNMTLFSFDKGQYLSEHSAPFDAVVQVLEGEAEIRIDGVSHFLSAEQMIIMPADIPHAVNAVTEFKMLLTMIRG